MSGDSAQGLFATYAGRLRHWLTEREATVGRLEAMVNAQRTPSRYMQGRAYLSRQLEECFPGNTGAVDLEQAHWAAGFKPREVQYLFNDLIHPVELMLRGVHCWQQTRWPGRGDRLHYAHTLFNLYVLRCLQFLSMRLWDEDPGGAKGRLTELQGLLDELWKSSPAGQPAFVRDARWLIPLALSLITDELAPYFEVVQQFADTLPEADRLEIDRAHVRMLGGHLTSQIRYYCTKDGIAIDDASVVLRTRTSNALDLALLVQGLVGLLRAYEAAPDEQRRLEMAGAIFQGISPDPELFVHRLDLLRAYTMIEQVLVADGEYTPHGARHVRLVEEYKARMERLLPKLREDVAPFRPMAGGCSPYGVLAGLPSNLIEHMALKAVQRDAETRFSLEDVFDDGGPGAAKLAWVNGWRRLPHVPREVQRAFEYPQGFAEEIFARIEREIGRSGGFKTGRLLLTDAPEIPELEARYFADSGNPQQLLRDRQEGHYLVSYQTPGGWVAVKKELLTEVLGAGRDTRIGGLPQDAAQVLRRMCGELASG